MMWTTVEPTQPGWYWWRGATPVIVQLTQVGGTLQMAFRGQTLNVKGTGGQWYGPLVPPGEEKPGKGVES